MGELRKEVTLPLSQDRIYVDDEHLREREHRVTDWEIRTALLDGQYDYHDDIEDRYVAEYRDKTQTVAVAIMFEIQETSEGRYIFVATAFRSRRRTR